MCKKNLIIGLFIAFVIGVCTTIIIVSEIRTSNSISEPSNEPIDEKVLDSYDITLIINEPNTNTNQLLWPNATVPYIIDERLSWSQKRAITVAYDYYTNYTQIRLVEYDNKTHDSFVVFTSVNDSECFAYIGRKVGWQIVNIGVNCGYSVVIHEIMHALGWYHEHARPDRDAFVTVEWDNIIQGKSGNFRIVDSLVYSLIEQYTAYDYASIMHYPTHLFSRNGKATLVYNTDVTRNNFSKTDLLELKMYKLNTFV